MAFLRVIEVFPPLFPSRAPRGEGFNAGERIKQFVEEARRIRELADIILVADVKDLNFLKLSTLETAVLLQGRLKVKVAPVIVVRDFNSQKFLSAILTGISLGLKSMMIAWGDRYPGSVGASNVRDFPGLAAAIRQASKIRKRACAPTVFLAPVDIDRLDRAAGVTLAKERLRAGADYLLAQPPTTDAGRTFERHRALVEGAGLRDRVLLNVFPFRGAADAKECEKYFGWKLPPSLHRAAASGPPMLLEMERNVIMRLREEGFPGVYLNTRGDPRVAMRLLS